MKILLSLVPLLIVTSLHVSCESNNVIILWTKYAGYIYKPEGTLEKFTDHNVETDSTFSGHNITFDFTGLIKEYNEEYPQNDAKKKIIKIIVDMSQDDRLSSKNYTVDLKSFKQIPRDDVIIFWKTDANKLHERYGDIINEPDKFIYIIRTEHEFDVVYAEESGDFTQKDISDISLRQDKPRTFLSTKLSNEYLIKYMFMYSLENMNHFDTTSINHPCLYNNLRYSIEASSIHETWFKAFNIENYPSTFNFAGTMYNEADCTIEVEKALKHYFKEVNVSTNVFDLTKDTLNAITNVSKGKKILFRDHQLKNKTWTTTVNLPNLSVEEKSEIKKIVDVNTLNYSCNNHCIENYSQNSKFNFVEKTQPKYNKGGDCKCIIDYHNSFNFIIHYIKYTTIAHVNEDDMTRRWTSIIKELVFLNGSLSSECIIPLLTKKIREKQTKPPLSETTEIAPKYTQTTEETSPHPTATTPKLDTHDTIDIFSKTNIIIIVCLALTVLIVLPLAGFATYRIYNLVQTRRKYVLPDYVYKPANHWD